MSTEKDRLPLDAPCKRGHVGYRVRLKSGVLRCHRCAIHYQKVYFERHPEKRKDQFSRYNKKKNAKRRAELLEAYGGFCACCGETAGEFLTVDHISGNGRQHRREIGDGGHALREWLRSKNYPKDNFQLLCWNCNCAKGKYGYCPHERRDVLEAYS